MDISKAIDRAAGAEREVIGMRDTKKGNGGTGLDFLTPNSRERFIDITAPATDVARDWEGWGTQLKPAVEPILVFQKPIAERTIAANVLAHGTGGLNIDACRVATVGARRLIDARGRTTPSMFGAMGGSVSAGETSQGRFPANLVLSHAPATSPPPSASKT
jgi:site-specific DNA-methyltransferase (adenine-specific)